MQYSGNVYERSLMALSSYLYKLVGCCEGFSMLQNTFENLTLNLALNFMYTLNDIWNGTVGKVLVKLLLYYLN